MASSDTLDTPVSMDVSDLQRRIDEIIASLSSPVEVIELADDDDDVIYIDTTHPRQGINDEHILMKTDTEDDPHAAVELKVFLWNIHGDSSGGMAEARKLLVGEVVRRCNPDVLLLQEVEARRTIEHIATKCQPRDYVFNRSTKPTEAYIMYDKHCFEFVSSIDLPEIIGDTELIPDGRIATRSRSGDKVSSVFYDNRSCAIRLRHRGTGKELVLMSFHNASTRTGGRKPNIISLAKGFLKLVCMVHDHEGVLVIAGGDFNCDRSDLLVDARELQCELPDYATSKRRKLHEKIDVFILKSSSSVKSAVEVFEALPLADPTSVKARFHPLGCGSIRYLLENAPVKKKGRKLSHSDYEKTTNHDSTINTITL